jgi:hypothetical protein
MVATPLTHAKGGGPAISKSGSCSCNENSIWAESALKADRSDNECSINFSFKTYRLPPTSASLLPGFRPQDPPPPLEPPNPLL